MSVLRPRDIQARIRAGESPEAVAEAAQTTVEKIAGFANPALAERAYVAQQAQRASVRRRAGDGSIGALGEAVAARLAADGGDPQAVEWDSWRREDGRWTLVADFAVAGDPRRATFAFDTAGRYVVPDDDEARRLVGERVSAPATEQLDLGDDAIEVVTGRRPEPVAAQGVDADRSAGEPTVDLGPVAEAVRSAPASSPVSATSPAPATSPVSAPREWMATQASERPEPDEPLFDAAPAVAPAATADDDAAPAPSSEEPPRRAKRGSRAKGRASVPSWDEIMFGSGRGTD